MIQLIVRSKAFHSTISKTIVGIQEVNSPYSLDEISLSTPMCLEEEEESKRCKDGRV